MNLYARMKSENYPVEDYFRSAGFSNFNTAISKIRRLLPFWFIFNSWTKSQCFDSNKQTGEQIYGHELRNKAESERRCPGPEIKAILRRGLNLIVKLRKSSRKGFRPSRSTFRAFHRCLPTDERLRVGGKVKFDRDYPGNTCASRKACLLPATKVNQKNLITSQIKYLGGGKRGLVPRGNCCFFFFDQRFQIGSSLG